MYYDLMNKYVDTYIGMYVYVVRVDDGRLDTCTRNEGRFFSARHHVPRMY